MDEKTLADIKHTRPYNVAFFSSNPETEQEKTDQVHENSISKDGSETVESVELGSIFESVPDKDEQGGDSEDAEMSALGDDSSQSDSELQTPITYPPSSKSGDSDSSTTSEQKSERGGSGSKEEEDDDLDGGTSSDTDSDDIIVA